MLKAKILSRPSCAIVGALGIFLLPGSATAAPIPVASYLFNGTLSAQQSGVASLTAVNPLGSNTFTTDTVFGQTRTVYQYTGAASPPSQQAGLTLDTTGLVSNTSYSVEIVFKFTQGSNTWRRILDVQNRQSDNGFYVNPSNQLAAYPVTGGASFSNNIYHNVILVNASGNVSAYLDGAIAFSTPTSVMNISNVGNLMNFFLDNTSGGGLGEYSNGSVAKIGLYSNLLSAADVAELALQPFPITVPGPGGLPLFGLGLMALFLIAKQHSKLNA